MPYPDRLLPQPHYKLLNFDSSLIQLIYFIRRTATSDLLDENNKLKAEHVAYPTDKANDYSINLLGEFKPNDIRWKLRGAYLEDWIAGQEISKPIEGQDVTEEEEFGRFFLAISKFHRVKFEVRKEGAPNEQAICIVLHTPNKGNFWHCSLRWESNGVDVDSWNPKKRRHIMSVARTFIIENAILNPTIYQVLPLSSYSTS